MSNNNWTGHSGSLLVVSATCKADNGHESASSQGKQIHGRKDSLRRRVDVEPDGRSPRDRQEIPSKEAEVTWSVGEESSASPPEELQVTEQAIEYIIQPR